VDALAADSVYLSRIHLEPWLATSASVIWSSTRCTGKALDLWKQALPGRESDARHRDSVHEIITDLFALEDSWNSAARNTRTFR
jgi:hypothetical protein